jgi:hypothetical protein
MSPRVAVCYALRGSLDQTESILVASTAAGDILQELRRLAFELCMHDLAGVHWRIVTPMTEWPWRLMFLAADPPETLSADRKRLRLNTVTIPMMLRRTTTRMVEIPHEKVDNEDWTCCVLSPLQSAL